MLRSLAEPSSIRVTSTASSAGRNSQATLVYRPNTSSTITVLDSVEKEWIDSLKMPKKFITCAFSLLQQSPQGQIIEIRNMLQQWGRWDVLESLASYHRVVKLLFGALKDALSSTQLKASHVLAEEIFQCLSQDLCDLEEQLVAIFRDSESYKNFLACRGDLAQRLLDLLQDLLDSFPESSTRPRLSKALERLSRASGLHPTCFPLTGLKKVGQQVAAGGFGDIWEGLVGGQSVSVKIMRLFRDVDMKEAMQEFGHEAIIWRQLSHPNLLPFFGLYYLENRLCLVSPWMSNGHIIEFLKNAPPDTDRVSLMLDVAMGVKYLHENRIVHGDLKGMNVLVTPSYRACVADFGLASIAEAVTLRFTHSTASPKGGTARYQAPELLSTEIPNHFGSDVYAFGSVCYEILTEKAPFFEISRDITVTIKVLEGLRPSRPDTIPVDHDLWRLLQDCWQATPGDRPSISQIIQRLDSIIGAKPEDAVADWDESISSKSRRSLQDWPLLPSIAAIERRIFADGVFSCPKCFPERIDDLVPSESPDVGKTDTKWFPEARRYPSPPTMPEIPLAKPSSAPAPPARPLATSAAPPAYNPPPPPIGSPKGDPTQQHGYVKSPPHTLSHGADTPTSALLNTRRKRAHIACKLCRKRKIKCVTTEEPPRNPCTRCTKRGLTCEYVAVEEEEPDSPLHPMFPPPHGNAAPRYPTLGASATGDAPPYASPQPQYD
ncbi:kinase-like domain-containing protein [Mycena albidolilacea]|uniref:Kinase-like domain-containing protein n=1 Tax=Mycena albidolilacea TaxID=1033008 RepID=A0AAD7AIA0_9AGAR|nr:kinase-like domain-containing protein [Mycena albidolilacea]